MGKVFIGCDPDIRNLSVVAIDEESRILWIAMVKEPDKNNRGRVATKHMCSAGVRRFISWYLEEADLPDDEIAAIAVEGQAVEYSAKKGVNPQDIVNLAGVAGGMISVMSALAMGCEVVRYPKPSEWKGSVPKHIHQMRTVNKIGIEYVKKGGQTPYPVPTKEALKDVTMGPDKINGGDWKDITDSLGLALWAKEEYYKELKRRK